MKLFVNTVKKECVMANKNQLVGEGWVEVPKGTQSIFCSLVTDVALFYREVCGSMHIWDNGWKPSLFTRDQVFDSPFFIPLWDNLVEPIKFHEAIMYIGAEVEFLPSNTPYAWVIGEVIPDWLLRGQQLGDKHIIKEFSSGNVVVESSNSSEVFAPVGFDPKFLRLKQSFHKGQWVGVVDDIEEKIDSSCVHAIGLLKEFNMFRVVEYNPKEAKVTLLVKQDTEITLPENLIKKFDNGELFRFFFTTEKDKEILSSFFNIFNGITPYLNEHKCGSYCFYDSGFAHFSEKFEVPIGTSFSTLISTPEMEDFVSTFTCRNKENVDVESHIKIDKVSDFFVLPKNGEVAILPESENLCPEVHPPKPQKFIDSVDIKQLVKEKPLSLTDAIFLYEKGFHVEADHDDIWVEVTGEQSLDFLLECGGFRVADKELDLEQERKNFEESFKGIYNFKNLTFNKSQGHIYGGYIGEGEEAYLLNVSWFAWVEAKRDK